MKKKITFEQFLEIEKSLEIKFGDIIEVEAVPKSTKLLKLIVDFGESETRTILTNVGADFKPEYLLGQQLPFITNLEPVKIMGIESQGMIMIATDGAEKKLVSVSRTSDLKGFNLL